MNQHSMNNKVRSQWTTWSQSYYGHMDVTTELMTPGSRFTAGNPSSAYPLQLK